MNVAILGTLARTADELVEIGAADYVYNPTFSALCAESGGDPGGDGYGWDKNESTYARYPTDSDNLYTKIDFGESKYVHSIRVRWGGVDIEATCTIATSPDNSTWTTIATWGNLNTYYDAISGWFTVNRDDVRYIRIMRGVENGYIRSYYVGIKVWASDVTELTASSTDITGLSPTAWYDANNSGSITQSGGVVSAWNDISGNGYHSAQTTEESRPSVISEALNGLDVIRFDGTSDFLDATSTAKGVARNIGAISIFAVATNTGGDTYREIMCWTNNTTGNRASLHFKSGEAAAGGRREDGDSFQEVTVAQSGTSVVGAEFDYANAEAYINMDGYRTAKGGFQDEGNTSDTDSGVVAMGGVSATVNSLQGDIAEIIIFQSILSTANRQLVEGYLAQKWGLDSQLWWGHPYKDKY